METRIDVKTNNTWAVVNDDIILEFALMQDHNRTAVLHFFQYITSETFGRIWTPMAGATVQSG